MQREIFQMCELFHLTIYFFSRQIVLTLCKSDANGSYRHAIIPLPSSYEVRLVGGK